MAQMTQNAATAKVNGELRRAAHRRSEFNLLALLPKEASNFLRAISKTTASPKVKRFIKENWKPIAISAAAVAIGTYLILRRRKQRETMAPEAKAALH